jgi:Zn finger protein HypA/HybF involved in hydrogenase expression
MHERSLARDAVRRVEAAARDAGTGRIARVRLTIGALAGVSAEHFRRHFAEAARGGRAEGAALDIREGDGVATPDADGLRIESIEVEEE